MEENRITIYFFRYQVFMYEYYEIILNYFIQIQRLIMKNVKILSSKDNLTCSMLFFKSQSTMLISIKCRALVINHSMIAIFFGLMRQQVPYGSTVYIGFLSDKSRDLRLFSTAILSIGNAVVINFRQRSYRCGKSPA